MSEPTYITPVQKVVELQAALDAANAEIEWREERDASLTAEIVELRRDAEALTEALAAIEVLGTQREYMTNALYHAAVEIARAALAAHDERVKG